MNFISRLVDQYSAEPYGGLGYRQLWTMTREDRQRLRQVRENPSGCLCYSLDQGDDLMRMTYTTPGGKKWKRLGMLVKLFVRQADIGFLVTVHEMYIESRRQDMAEVVYGNQARPAPACTEVTTAQRSSGRRTSSNVVDWSTEFGYGLPMSRMIPNSMRLTDPALRGFDVRDWLRKVDECERPSSHSRSWEQVQVEPRQSLTTMACPWYASTVEVGGRCSIWADRTLL